MKTLAEPSGIEPATFRLVAQFLNQLRRRSKPINKYEIGTFDFLGYGCQSLGVCCPEFRDVATNA
jgi:hypothetical protein